MKIWISLALVAIAFGATKAQDDDYVFPDYWQNDYGWYSDEAENLGIVSSKEKNEQESDPTRKDDPEGTDIVGDTPETKLNEENKNILQEIEEFRKTLENENDRDSFDVFDDYQFEDNRSNPDKEQLDVADEVVEQPNPAEAMENEYADTIENDSINLEDTQVDKQSNEELFDKNLNMEEKIVENQDILSNDEKDEAAVNEPIFDVNNNQEIFDETRDILAEDDADETAIFPPLDDENQKIFDETRDILAEDDADETAILPPPDDDNQNIFDETRDILNNDEGDNINTKEIISETQNILNSDEDKEVIEEPPINNDNNQDIFDETRAILDDDDENNKLTDEFPNSDIRDNVDISDVLQNDALNTESDSQDSPSDELSDEINKKELDDILKIFNERVIEELANISESENDGKYSDSNEVKETINKNNGDSAQVDEKIRNSKETVDVPSDNKDESQSNEDDETIDKVSRDRSLSIDDDLKQLFDTWDKLTNDEVEDDDTSNEDVLKYEEKYGKPYREDIVLSQRDDDYEVIEDSDLDQIFAKLFEESKSDRVAVKYDDPDKQIDLPITKKIDNDNEHQIYDNDGIDADESTKMAKEKTDLKESNDDISAPVHEQTLGYVNSERVDSAEKEPIKTLPVEDLTPSQYDDVMKQFAAVHGEHLNTNSEDFGRNVAPYHKRLSVDEPTIVASPNYPGNYNPNDIVDWIFDGDGIGIELNITDFAVNGVAGDYLLIKPGGVDDTRQDGIIFSYTLNEQRNFRFLDVDRMFVRFESKPAMIGMRGFQFSVKMVAPIPEEPEPEPEPVPHLPVPRATMTVHLGSLTLRDFLEVKNEFRQIIADMATLYINSNSIDKGLNTTEEITQITRAELCNVDWPDFEFCSAVTFAVPLVYEDERAPARLNRTDLETMWNLYKSQAPFNLRLSRLGIEEFSEPNDNMVMWIVMASGLVISMSIVACGLWRCRCFKNYTRMAAYSDTDSMNEKRTLDLYPTPHQTLPPLYADQDIKWDDDIKFDDSTRVDMGGFANRSYVRDDLFDIDSDEDIVTTPRDRNSFSPRDIYQV